MSMEITTEFNHLNGNFPPGWYNLHAKRRRNALGHIFLDYGLLGRIPLRAFFVPYIFDKPMWYSNESKHLDNSDHEEEDGKDYQVLHLWRQVSRLGRRNGEWNIFLTQRHSSTTK
ncbi:hypothetical protein CHS0354_009631 [Potamilus streckersoni]|uniref:Uncharacterized protein n=1 Tax=Potamilus streckersoni TaxID=2493646 RepID=A0AAE0S3X0_9BIVA|nr:hypothetical protein CHS0354_009631 [Potamilus streckersoni]